MTAPATPSSAVPSLPRPQRLGAILVLVGIVMVAVALTVQYSWRQGSLFLIGCLLGLTLYHASFGFASSYRQLFLTGRVDGVLAQVVMLAVATVLFAPFLLSGTSQGAVAPVGVVSVVGAFLFGIGMQLGSGCACGTLYTIGGGSSMMLFTLVSFCGGSFAASLLERWWWFLPRWPSHSLIGDWGLGGVGVQLLVLAAVGVVLWRWRGDSWGSRPNQHWIFGPWSLLAGGVALAVLNTLTLWIAGRPWGVTWGFTLWTAKLATWVGWDPASSPVWQDGFAARALSESVWADITSVMNIGIIIGAAWAATLAGKLGIRRPPSRWAVVAALLGGLLMGFGARMSFGCNVGAYFSGIASTSWHGWSWIAFALLGSWIGIPMRPWFGLTNESRPS